MNRIKDWWNRREAMTRKQATAFFLAVALIGLSFHAAFPPHYALAQPTANIPFATTVSVTTSSAQLIPPNPSRRALTVCTPANTNVVAIAPQPIVPVQPGGPGIIITGTATASTCFTTALVQNSGTSGGVGNGWNAIASGTTNVLVLEY